MISITEDAAHNALIAEPDGRLTTADFDALRERFNEMANTRDRIPNLVIHAPSFPGWADVSARVEHLQFITAHEKLVDKIALGSDSLVLDIAPKIAGHFLSASIRQFPADALADALAWSAEPVADASHVEIMQDLPADVVGISVHGMVTAKDYREAIAPLVDKAHEAHGKIKLLYHVGPEFEGFTPGAAWNDARLGVMHLTQFSKIAVVSDLAWIGNSVRLFAPLVPADVHVFPEAKLADAKAWISAPDPSG